MAKKKKTSNNQIRKLSFLIGDWHTEGKILRGTSGAEKEIRGMDTYQWIAGGFFILHKVDVFMADQRTEVIEIIGYDKARRSFFMKSFDNQGEATTMYATLERPGVLTLGDDKMRSTLTANKRSKTMRAKWEMSDDGKTWQPWMELTFIQ